MKRQLAWSVVVGLVCVIGTLGASVIAFVIVYFLDGRAAATAVAVATGLITAGAFVYGSRAGRRHQRTNGLT